MKPIRFLKSIFYRIFWKKHIGLDIWSKDWMAKATGYSYKGKMFITKIEYDKMQKMPLLQNRR
jgi:hypothetical protein